MVLPDIVVPLIVPPLIDEPLMLPLKFAFFATKLPLESTLKLLPILIEPPVIFVPDILLPLTFP